RDGKEITVTATPELMEQQDGLGNKVKVAVIGVVNNQEFGQPRLITYNPVAAVGAAVEETGYIIQRTGQFL
ncbi:MAG: RIP metalloprotease RseP, partial [Mesorhizobium sp.]